MPWKHRKRGRTEPTLGDIDKPEASPSGGESDGLPHVSVADRPSGSVRTEPRRSRKRSRQRPPRRRSSTWRTWLWPLLAVVLAILLAWAWVNQDTLRDMLPRTRINAMLEHADQALARGDLEGDTGNSARELYSRVLDREPDNNIALRGLRSVGNAELARASSLTQAGEYDHAEQYIANARELLGGGVTVAHAASALRQARHPEQQRHATLAAARRALRAGDLTGDDGAAALYQQVLSVEADNRVAQQGLQHAGDALAARARKALRAGDEKRASSLIGSLGHFVPDHADLPSLRARMAQMARASSAATKAALENARHLLQKGHVSGPGDNNARAAYQKVLERDPSNTKARAGLKNVARALVVQANAAIDTGHRQQARQLLAQAASIAPASLALQQARARADAMPGGAGAAASFPAATSTRGSVDTDKRDRLLARAQSAAQAGDIMLPPGDSAYDLYRDALLVDPGSQEARQGLHSLADTVGRHFDKALAAGHLQRAEQYLETMRSLNQGGTRADSMAGELATAWLHRTRSRMQAGRMDAARAALNEARQLAPNNPEVESLQEQMASG